MQRRSKAALCFIMAGLVAIYHVNNTNSLGIKDKVDDLTYLLWIHFQIHHTFYSVVCVIVGLLILAWPEEDNLLSADFGTPLNKPAPEPQGEIIHGSLEIMINGYWQRVHQHQLNEFLSDDQISDMRELEAWRQAQDPITSEEVEHATETYFLRKDQIVKTRPARMEVS